MKYSGIAVGGPADGTYLESDLPNISFSSKHQPGLVVRYKVQVFTTNDTKSGDGMKQFNIWCPVAQPASFIMRQLITAYERKRTKETWVR